MPIKVTSNFNGDDFMKNVKSQVLEATEAAIVDELVKEARKEGLNSSESIDLKLDSEMRSIGVDKARVLRAVDKKLRSPLTR